MKNAGMRWLALNVGDHSWESWRVVVDRARAISLTVIPWARCYTIEQIDRLLSIASDVSFQAIVNVEDEFKSTLSPDDVAKRIAFYDDVDSAISTPAWLYNDVDYRALSQTPFLLQLFASDMRREPRELEQIQKDCCLHAREKGIENVGVTFQTYFPAQPEWYSYWSGVRSYFTGDDIGQGSWSKWA